MTDEWGPWIEHDGKGCPVVGQVVQAELSEEPEVCPPWAVMIAPRLVQAIWQSSKGEWEGEGGPLVIRYRVRKPRGMVVLESLMAELPERVDA